MKFGIRLLVKGISSLTNTHISLVAKIHSCASLHILQTIPSCIADHYGNPTKGDSVKPPKYHGK